MNGEKIASEDLFSFTDPTSRLSPSIEARLPSELPGSEAVRYADPFPIGYARSAAHFLWISNNNRRKERKLQSLIVSALLTPLGALIPTPKPGFLQE